MNLRKIAGARKPVMRMFFTRTRLLSATGLLAVGLQSALAEPQFPVLQTTATGAVVFCC